MILATAAQILGSNPKREAGAPRIAMSRLLYAQMSGGFGLVLNLSERGMAIQTMVSLNVGQTLKFVLPLSEDTADVSGAELRGQPRWRGATPLAAPDCISAMSPRENSFG